MAAKVSYPAAGEPALSAYLNAKGCREGLPITGNFELTARCNFHCSMCYIHTQQPPELLRLRELSADQWLSIASDARDMGMIFLLLTGGEPLVREDFPTLYEQLIKMGLMVSINTNASLYGPELRSLFLRWPPARINATLYGGREETYEALCGAPAFGRVVENLRRMKEDGLQVGLNVSLTPENAADMEQISTLARQLDVPARAAAYMYPPVRAGGTAGDNPGRFSPEEAGEALARWYQLRDSREIFCARAQTLGHAPSDCGEVHCRAGRSSFWMTWDGRMLPCGTIEAGAADPLRNGFSAAWEQVRTYAAAIPTPRTCAVCPNRSVCPVCPAACMAETGSFEHSPAYLCRMTDSMTRAILNQAQEMEASR